MTNKLKRTLKVQKKSTKQEVPQIVGSFGIPINGRRTVEVPNRNSFVYVRLRDNQNEVIQAYNNKVAASYNLPVVVERQNNRYVVVGVDTLRYQNNWNSFAPFLPIHGNAHSFNPETGGGGDVVWVYPRQFMPALIIPSGTNGGPNVFFAPYTLLKSDGNWMYVGNTGTSNITLYKPTNNQAVMVLVYLDTVSGNPYLRVGSGSYFSASITGSSEVVPYIPTLTNSDYLPLAAVRLVSGTSTISWDNIYDVRQFFSNLGSGGSGTGDTLWELGSGGQGIRPTEIGNGNDATAQYALAHGQSNDANALASHAEGQNSIANGLYSHAEGNSTSNGQYSHSEGQGRASGTYSHAEGQSSISLGSYSHSEGQSTLSIGDYSHAEGQSSESRGLASHAEGQGSVALGDSSHAEGQSTLALGFASHAEGLLSIASGTYSHAEGVFNLAAGDSSFVLGSSNVATAENSSILSGHDITGTYKDAAHVDLLNIHRLSSGTSVANLGIDSRGMVVTGTSGGGGSSILGVVVQEDGVTLGTGTTLNFAGNVSVSLVGDVATIQITGSSSSACGTYFRVGQPSPLGGVSGTYWIVPDYVYASGSLGVFLNGHALIPNVDYVEHIYVSGTYQYLFSPPTGTYHMVHYGVPCSPQTYIPTGTISGLLDSMGNQMTDSSGNLLTDSNG